MNSKNINLLNLYMSDAQVQQAQQQPPSVQQQVTPPPNVQTNMGRSDKVKS